jgi:Uma2 family endonuclease
LDLENEPQPDLALIKTPAKGGQARVSREDYIEGAPELAGEIVGSSQAYDLHQKKGAFRRNGVREYLAWFTGANRFVWWELREEEYREIAPAEDGLLKSTVFPGLWLDTAALLRGDLKGVLAALRRGLDSAEHRVFAAT